VDVLTSDDSVRPEVDGVASLIVVVDGRLSAKPAQRALEKYRLVLSRFDFAA